MKMNTGYDALPVLCNRLIRVVIYPGVKVVTVRIAMRDPFFSYTRTDGGETLWVETKEGK